MTKEITKEEVAALIKENKPIEIFVFGSNLAGRHGKGAALTAINEYGAIYGQGIGLQGNSYAIPTKDRDLKTLPLYVIEDHIRDFVNYAYKTPDLMFKLTRVGCGLAGYKDSDIFPLFKKYGIPRNVLLPPEWIAYDQLTDT